MRPWEQQADPMSVGESSPAPPAGGSVEGLVGLRHLERLRLGVALQVLALHRRQGRTPSHARRSEPVQSQVRLDLREA